MNVESLPAKIDKLKVLLQSLVDDDFTLHIICLQECWMKKKTGKDINSLNLLKLPGYKMFYKGSNIGRKGGLVTYIHTSITSSKKINFFNDSPSETWEGLTIEIESESFAKPVLIHNVYRPPRKDHRAFIDEFKRYANSIKCHKIDSIVCGDFNYDLTQVNKDAKCKEYLSIMLGNKLAPKITLPTKFNIKSCKLIDHIFTRIIAKNEKSDACILISKISDHQPIILSIGTKLVSKKKPEYRDISDFSEKHVTAFLKGLAKSITETKFPITLECDPNIGYDRLINLIH
jgi:endonuclease/exonuclease/phosphatase family metal-dependent hydrolase